MQAIPPPPPGKEAVTQNLVLKHIHRRNNQRLDRRIVSEDDVEWMLTIGEGARETRIGYIDTELAERAAYWPAGVNADAYCGPRAKAR
jgi:hypothetical protein